MTSNIFNLDLNSTKKRKKLDSDHDDLEISESDHKERAKIIKLEPIISNYYSIGSVSLDSSNGSKDMSLKIYPILNISDNKSNDSLNNNSSNGKSIKVYLSNVPKLAKGGAIQLKVKSDPQNFEDNYSHLRPSEALFVRCLVPHCKRLAPLWFKGVSSMREKNREEHRRISAATSCQNQNDWEMISDLIGDMNSSSETETVVNLLKKLYKELPADTVLWFIKCWLNFPEAVENEDKCALSRGDAKGRMRRIDGGKGSDKVWRLDTIVGMMYHGIPMSSTDTNIMVHTCEQELCIRPQHLRFKASSVAFVVVLKALQQTGYSIIPPSDNSYLNDDGRDSPTDEYVDVSGPFKIEQLQQYRLEELKPSEQSMGKLNSGSSDITLLETYPLLKNYYPTYSDELKKSLTDKASRRSMCYNIIRRNSGLKRPAQTTSNSTGSPPNISVEGSSQQCHSPPNLSSDKPQCNNVAPTPRKPDVIVGHILNNFIKVEDSPSSIFSNSRDKDSYGQAPDLIAEEPCESKPSCNDVVRPVSRLTDDSPIVGSSITSSGKNTPRQPAKKRLEARTPTFNEPTIETISSVSSPSDKLCLPNNSISAFKVWQKQNLKNHDSKCDEIEDEMDTIFTTSANNREYFSNCHPDGPLLSETTNMENLGNGKNSELDSDMYMKSEPHARRTSSSLDILLMAISSQTPTALLSEDQSSTCANSVSYSNQLSRSPLLDGQKTNVLNRQNLNSPKLPKSSAVSCRFTPEQASVLLNAMRNSPLGNNNPEIIEILYNMIQQYGTNNDQSIRPDSVLLRKHIYHQLSKASPQLDSLSHTPIMNEMNDLDGIRSSPYQRQASKASLHTVRSTAYLSEN